MQGFQAHIHIQHHWDTSSMAGATQPKSAVKKRLNDAAAEEACEPKETLNKDMASIALSDAGSTVNSTNNENTPADTVKAKQPIVSRTNVGKQPMESHGKTPGLTEKMWLDEMSMITIIGFTKLADKCGMQHDNFNGESFQVHAEVGMMKFR